MQEIDITPGQVVYSKAGRDRYRYFVVLEILENDYVLISDGETRPIERPKRKKLKHLTVHNMVASDIKNKIESNSKIMNSDIRDSLKSMGLVNQLKGKEV